MITLRALLRLNAASCLVFGSLFVGGSHQVAAFLGSMSPLVVFGIGLGLVGNGLHLALASTRPVLRAAEILWFSIGDLAWWSATAAILGAGLWVDTTTGMLAAASVSVIVSGLGLAQLFELGRERRRSPMRITGDPSGAHGWRFRRG